MNRLRTIKLDRERSKKIHIIIGIFLIFLGFLLIWKYIIHFFRIILAIALFFGGVFFLVKDTRFRWFRIRRF